MFIKKYGKFLLVILPLVFLLVLVKNNFSSKNILLAQDNYVITYDKVTDTSIKDLARYDMAILEPLNVKKEHIDFLKKSKTISYGYQSIFEVGNYNTEKIASLKEDDYLCVKGVRQYNEKFQCYYGDIRSDHYREVLIKSIQDNVIGKGFDGVFFDTLDDIEFHIDEPLRTELFNEYIDFFAELNRLFPQLSIIQNRAFNMFLLGSSHYIDGLMYEDLQHQVFTDPETGPFYNNLEESLSAAARENDNVILALAYKDEKENQALAKKLGWLFSYYSD